MKIFSVIGTSKTGKTTTIENIIKELKRRKYSIGSIKEIHYEKFAIDSAETNTDRHRKAGSELVIARGNNETDTLFPSKLSIPELLAFYTQDFIVMEGVTDYNLPKIVTASTEDEIENLLDRSVFAISGKISNKISSYRGIPVINSIKDAFKLTDLIEEKVFECLPDFPPECCSACGHSCRELGFLILEGKASRKDCIVSDTGIELYIGGKRIIMVPFVQDILRSVVEGVVKNLDGYKEGKEIMIKIGWQKQPSSDDKTAQ